MAARSPRWTPSENAQLRELRKQKMTGYRLFTAFHVLFPHRTEEAVKQHIQILRRDRKVR